MGSLHSEETEAQVLNDSAKVTWPVIGITV